MALPIYHDVQADYLVIGAGASGMAFVDTLLSESSCRVIIVDELHKPGGHWNHAYSFVTLHQPSSFYGVNSKELSSGQLEKTGLNEGLAELASGAEVQAYFDRVMNDTFLPTGRVHYFPLCRYLGEGRVEHLVTGKIFNVGFSKKLVDTTVYKTSIPLTHTRQFSCASSIKLIPPNSLPEAFQSNHAIGKFVVLGGGKTAIDTVLWLLTHGVDALDIVWFMPRDAWLLDRRNTQPSDAFFEYTIGAQASQMESIANSASLQDMFFKLEKSGVLLRIDSNVLPTMFHGATVSEKELDLLRRVKGIVRKGRVSAITEAFIQCEKGRIDTPEKALFIDCTASAITNLSVEPVFQDKVIKVQTIRAYQPTFSASLIAYVELKYEHEKQKNLLCKPVPLPNTLDDWVEMTYRNLMNQFFWSKEPELRSWIKHQRLDGFSQLVSNVKFYQINKLRILNRMRKAAKPAIAKLKAYRKQRAD